MGIMACPSVLYAKVRRLIEAETARAARDFSNPPLRGHLGLRYKGGLACKQVSCVRMVVRSCLL